jgi:hypothetical protein
LLQLMSGFHFAGVHHLPHLSENNSPTLLRHICSSQKCSSTYSHQNNRSPSAHKLPSLKHDIIIVIKNQKSSGLL